MQLHLGLPETSSLDRKTMTRQLNKPLILGLLSFLTLNCVGAFAMSNFLELKWEWPTNRNIESKLLVQIDSVGKVSSGLFNLGKSPSITSNLPDP